MGDAVISGLDHVQVAAPPGCEEEARRFYGGLLGLAEIDKPAALEPRGGCWFELGAQQLHVGVEPAFVASRKAYPAFRAGTRAGLEVLAARLAQAGADVRWDSDLPGHARFYVDDPWGNGLELLADDASKGSG